MRKIENAHQLKSLALAYMGDTVHDLYVREYLLRKGTIKPQELHQSAIRFVAAGSQAQVAKKWGEEETLTETEASVFRRGKNAKSGSVPKNTDVLTYRYATAFEAVLGYLYLSGDEERLTSLVQEAIATIEEKEGDK